MHLTRRKFIVGTIGGLGLTGIGVVGYTLKIGPHHLNIVHRPMPLPQLPASLAGKRLIHISDLHIGTAVSEPFLVRCLETINELEPDILCFTGDFMTCNAGEQIPHVRQMLDALEPAKLATLAIFGNHDYAHRWSNTEVAAQLAEALEQTPLTLLRNQSVDVQGLRVFGMDDLWAQQFDLDDAFASLQSNQAHLALSHNPDTVDLPGWDSFNGWILSGHTHGGQCKPPFLKPPLLPVENARYTQGVFALGDSRRTLHINPGLGHLLKARFMTRPEITVFELTGTG